MTHRFSACGYVLSFDDYEPALRMLARAGFVGIEGNDGILANARDDEIRSLAAAAVSAGVPFTSYHLPFGADHDIASYYETDRSRAVELIERSMRRASLFGADTVVLHPSTNANDVRTEGTEIYLRQLVRSIESLSGTAEELGLRIALENMMRPERLRFFSRPEHIRDFRERCDHDAVGFCLDTGHALISMGPERQHEIGEAMTGRLVALHLQDNPGDRDLHLAPGHGGVDFGGVFDLVKRDGVETTMCIESPPFAHAVPYTETAWRELRESVDSF